MSIFNKKTKRQYNKLANFSLFFISFVIAGCIFFINGGFADALPDPSAPPPEDNTPELLRIDESNQVKSGALRFGTDDQTSPYAYQLEVLGSGARTTEGIIDNTLKVNDSSETLFVDPLNNRVCVNSCVSGDSAILQIPSGRMRVTGLDEAGVRAVSADSEALYGYGATYGVQGVSSSTSGYGMWAVASLSAALEGAHTAVTPLYSAVGGFSSTGIGVYGTSLNLSNRWAGYFTGLLESNEIVSAAKILRTTEPESLIPYTEGQIAAQLFPELYPARMATDGKWLWIGQAGNGHNDLLRVDKGTGEVTARYTLGPAQDLMYDQPNGYIWQASDTYSGKIARVNIASGIAESRSVLDADAHGTCPYGFIVQDPNDSDILWALHAGGDCFGRDYHDRLEQFRISDYTDDSVNWQPIARYDIEHAESMTAPYSQGPRAITFDTTTNSLWLAFSNNDAVYRINSVNPGGGDATISASDYTRFSVPGPTDLVYDGNRHYMWASADDSGTGSDGAYYINIGSGTVSSRIATYAGPVGPQAITYDGTNIWVATTSGAPAGYVDRFPANNPSALSHFPANSNRSYRDILFDPSVNRVWVPSWYGRTVVGLESSTGSVAQTFDYSKIGFSILYHDNTYVWLSRGSELWKVRASDGFVAYQATLGAGMTEGFHDGNYFWVTARDADTVYKVNLYSGAIVCSKVFASGTKPVSIAFDGRSYWVSAQGTGEIINLSNTCAELSRTDVSNAANSLGKIIYNGSFLWAVSSAENAVVNMNPATRQAALWTGLVGLNPVDIVYDNVHYWVANRGTNSVTQYYLTNNKRCSLDQTITCSTDTDCAGNGGCFALPQAVGTFATGNEPVGIAFDGTHVWTANYAGQSLSRLQAADPNNRLDIPLAFAPQSLEFDGSYLWSTGTGNSGSAGVVKLFAGTGYGDQSFAEALSLQSTTVPTWQRGSYSITGDARVGNDVQIDGNVDALGNSWQKVGAGDVLTNFDDSTWPAMGALANATSVNAMVESAANTLVAGVNGSVRWIHLSSNQGTTWTQPAATPPGDRVQVMLRSGTRLFAGQGVITTMYYSDTNGATWQAGGALSAGQAKFDAIFQGSNGIIYVARSTNIHTGAFRISRSTDNGASWSDVYSSTNGIIYAFTDLPNGTILAGVDNGQILQSVDSGLNWTLLATLSPAEAIKSMTRAANGYLYAGTDTGGVFRSINNGVNWTKTALTGTTMVNALMQTTNGYLYAGTAGGKIFRSTDNGSSWSLLTTLSGTPQINTLLKTANGYLYAGAANGQVYRSGLGVLAPGTQTCPNGHYITNVTVNTAGGVVRIDCRGI